MSYRVNWNIEEEEISENEETIENVDDHNPPQMKRPTNGSNIIWTLVSSVLRLTKFSAGNKEVTNLAEDTTATGIPIVQTMSLTNKHWAVFFSFFLELSQDMPMSGAEPNVLGAVQPMNRTRIAGQSNDDNSCTYKRRIQCRPPIRRMPGTPHIFDS